MDIIGYIRSLLVDFFKYSLFGILKLMIIFRLLVGSVGGGVGRGFFIRFDFFIFLEDLLFFLLLVEKLVSVFFRILV